MSPIDVGECELIGEGTRRVCYAYPGDPARCIKIPKPGRHGNKQQLREVKFYEYLHRRKVPTDCIADYLGTVATTDGTGYVYQAIRDADGSISPLYIDVIEQLAQESPEALRDVLAQLERYLFDNLVVFYDINPWNVVCQRDASGSLHPFIIDGLGDIVAIPVLNLSRKLLLGKIRRRWIRVLQYMGRKHTWMADYQFNR